MKRLIIILMLIAMVLNISACKRDISDETAEPIVEIDVPETETETENEVKTDTEVKTETKTETVTETTPKEEKDTKSPESQDFIESDEEPLRCSAVIEDDFRDDMIMVCIKKGYSEVKQEYTVEDFPYLELRSVETGMKYIEGFRAVLHLYLNTPGKQNVLDAVSLLEKDGRIYYAGPKHVSLENQEEPLHNSPEIDDDFTDDVVFVFIKKQYSEIKQLYTTEDFPYLELEAVDEGMTYFPGNRVCLNLYLVGSTKQRIVDAISRLNLDERVYIVFPNRIITWEVELD